MRAFLPRLALFLAVVGTGRARAEDMLVVRVPDLSGRPGEEAAIEFRADVPGALV